jgi:hypothetical protein
MTGTTILAEAVFDVVSLITIAMQMATSVILHNELAPLTCRSPVPISSP